MPFIQQGEIANLPAYSYYARIAAVDAQEPMSGVTVVVNDNGSEEIARRVIDSSRARYAKKDNQAVPPTDHIEVKKAASTVRRKSLSVMASDELSGLSAVK